MREKRLVSNEPTEKREDTERFRADLRLLQDAFLRERILGSRELSEEKCRKRMQHLEIELGGPRYCVSIFAPYLMERNPEEIDELLMKITRRVREEYRKAGLDCCVISDGYCNAIAILSFRTEADNRTVETVTEKLARQLTAAYKLEMYVGIGDTVQRVTDLNKSHVSAGKALDYKFSFAHNRVINAKDIDRYYNPGVRDLKVHYDWIFGCFCDGDMNRLELRLHNLYAVVRVGGGELERMRNICIELMASILRRANELGVEISAETESVYTRIARMQSSEEILTWFLNYCRDLLQRIAELRQDKNRQIVKLAQDYIEANVGDQNLNTQTVSEYVDLSPAYFSGIFYRETGAHIADYINATRIRVAKRLLLAGNDKVVTIAEKLGFSSASYFNNVFKRYAGVTPKQYRESGGMTGSDPAEAGSE